MRVPVVGRDHRRDRGEPGAASLALRAEKLRQRRRLVRWALGHEPHGTRRPNRSPSPVAAAITSRIMPASTVGGFHGFRMDGLGARGAQNPAGSFARRAALCIVTWSARRTLPPDIHHASTVALAAHLPNRPRLLVALHRAALVLPAPMHLTVPRSWGRRDHLPASTRITGHQAPCTPSRTEANTDTSRGVGRLDIVQGIRKNLEMGEVGRDPDCRRADELRLDPPATSGRKDIRRLRGQQRGELSTGCVAENRRCPGDLFHLLDIDRAPGPAVRRARQPIADRVADQLDAVVWRANQGRLSVWSYLPLPLPARRLVKPIAVPRSATGTIVMPSAVFLSRCPGGG